MPRRTRPPEFLSKSRQGIERRSDCRALHLQLLHFPAFVRSGWCDARQRIQTCPRIGREIGSIQNQRPIAGHIDRRAPWQLCFRAAGGQDGDERTDPGGPTANQCSGTLLLMAIG
jgi:hypothetical protein